jgi:hypothetical protein
MVGSQKQPLKQPRFPCAGQGSHPLCTGGGLCQVSHDQAQPALDAAVCERAAKGGPHTTDEGCAMTQAVRHHAGWLCMSISAAVAWFLLCSTRMQGKRLTYNDGLRLRVWLSTIPLQPTQCAASQKAQSSMQSGALCVGRMQRTCVSSANIAASPDRLKLHFCMAAIGGYQPGHCRPASPNKHTKTLCLRYA